MTTADKTVVEPSDTPASEGWVERLDALLEWLGDRLNPILIKETRQALKSRQFLIWFTLLLIACWITTFGGIALIGRSIYFVSSGAYFLYAYYFILALPLLVVIPFSAYRSLSSEQEENTRDLLEVSSLSARRIINGKLGSAAMQMVLYLSVLAPCIAFTYLLRGVDVTTLLLLLIYAVLACMGLSTLGLAMAASTRQRHSQVLLSVMLVGGLFGSFSGLMGIAGAVLTLGTRDEEFWWANLGFFCLYATTLLLVYQAATALTTFASANRSTGLRVALVIQQAVYVAWLIGGFAMGLRAEEAVVVFMVFASIYWFAAGSVTTGESPTLSHRVRRELPQSLVGRICLTWFYPGPGSGYVFCVANLGTLLAIAIGGLVYLNLEYGKSVGEEMLAVGLMWAYVAGYLGLGRLVIIGLRSFAPISLLGCFLVLVLTALVGCVWPFALGAIFERLRVSNYLVLQMPSPIWTINELMEGGYDLAAQLNLGVGVYAVAMILFLVNLALAGRELRQQRVARPRRVIEDDLELHPSAATQPSNPWGDTPRQTDAGLAEEGA